jgi:hypothetical protein
LAVDPRHKEKGEQIGSNLPEDLALTAKTISNPPGCNLGTMPNRV